MRNRSVTPIVAAFIGVGVFSAMAFAGKGAQSAAAASPEVVLALRVSREAYAPGEPIQVTLEVTNRTREAVRLTFPTSQRFDLTLEDAAGQEVWRWSQGRFFLQVIGEQVLKPDPGALRYNATVPAPPKGGRYILRGRLASTNWPVSASTTIRVR
ncbi:MAG: BsuPI-related putative proteinase inhibitor [Nitrospinota bacterium]